MEGEWVAATVVKVRDVREQGQWVTRYDLEYVTGETEKRVRLENTRDIDPTRVTNQPRRRAGPREPRLRAMPCVMRPRLPVPTHAADAVRRFSSVAIFVLLA